MRKPCLAAAALLLGAAPAWADPIEGDWRTQSGATAVIAPCGEGFCITLKGGPYSGRRIGSFQSTGGGRYAGEITDPEKEKTYSGKGVLSGSTLKLSGCVLGGLICRSQNWTKK